MRVFPFASLFTRRRAAWIVGGIVVALLALLPDIAAAQTVSSAALFTPSSGDMSKSLIIDPLFGPLDGGSSNPLGSLIQNFNMAMMFLGGIIVAYTLVAGTLVTAHDGEMLGKQWSSLWVPIRTVIGTAFVMPILPGGFCVAQAIIIWAAMQSVGLADTLTGAFIQAQSSVTQQLSTTQIDDTPLRKTFGEMLVDLTCAESINQHEQTLNQSSDVTTSLGAIPTSQVYQTSTIPAAFAAGGAWSGSSTMVTFYPSGLAPDGACGNMIFTPPSVSSSSVGSGTASATSLYDSSALAQAGFQAQQGQINSVLSGLDKIAQDIVANKPAQTIQSEVDSTFPSLAQSWTQATNSALSGVPSNNTLVQNMTNDGWLMLGAWYMSMARAQQDVNMVASNIPAVSDISFQTASDQQNNSGFFSSLWSHVKNMSAEAVSGVAFTEADRNNVQTAASVAFNQGTTPGSGASSAPSQAAASASTSSWVTRAIGWFIGPPGSWAPSTAAGGGATALQQNPVVVAQNLGFKLIGAATAGLAATAVALLPLSATIPLGNLVAKLGILFAGLLATPGVFLAYYIPMVPLFLWLGAVFAWTVMLVEAVVGAPLWMVAHLMPEGNGLAGGGRQGYNLLLALVLRPPLMVVGFAAAVAIMMPIGNLINSVFLGAFLSAVQPSFFGFLSLIAGCIIYAYLMAQMAHKVFGLIHEVPDHAPQWFGINAGKAAHQHAEGLSSGMRATTAAVVTASGVNQLQNLVRDRIADNKGRADLQGELGGHQGAYDEASRQEQSARGAAQTANAGVGRAASRMAAAETALQSAQSNADSTRAAYASGGGFEAKEAMDLAQDELSAAQGEYQEASAQQASAQQMAQSANKSYSDARTKLQGVASSLARTMRRLNQSVPSDVESWAKGTANVSANPDDAPLHSVRDSGETPVDDV